MTNDPNPQADAGAKLAEAVRAYVDVANPGSFADLLQALAEYDAATKPKTVVVNGVEVLEPVRELLSDGDCYYIPQVLRADVVNRLTWHGNAEDVMLLSRGLIHLTRAAAESHARALIAATAQEKQA